MSYADFTNRELKEKFGVSLQYQDNLFTNVPKRQVSDWLRESIRRNKRMALAQAFEKPRSEFLIAPVLSELYTQAEEQISLFSGWDFNVAPELGLFGRADFLISRSTNQFEMEVPIVVAVEAKQDDFRQGAIQCTAEMIAARIFDERQGILIQRVYGCVATGDGWRFLILNADKSFVDTTIFDVSEDLERILGILWAMSFDEIRFS